MMVFDVCDFQRLFYYCYSSLNKHIMSEIGLSFFALFLLCIGPWEASCLQHILYMRAQKYSMHEHEHRALFEYISMTYDKFTWTLWQSRYAFSIAPSLKISAWTFTDFPELPPPPPRPFLRPVPFFLPSVESLLLRFFLPRPPGIINDLLQACTDGMNCIEHDKSVHCNSRCRINMFTLNSLLAGCFQSNTKYLFVVYKQSAKQPTTIREKFQNIIIHSTLIYINIFGSSNNIWQ